MTEKQVRDYDKFMLRFPDGMRDAIAERAKANGRSMNSEIIQILDNALTGSVADMDDEFIHAFNQVSHSKFKTAEEFNAVNEKTDWIISKLIERIEKDSSNVRVLLLAKNKLMNKKPT